MDTSTTPLLTPPSLTSPDTPTSLHHNNTDDVRLGYLHQFEVACDEFFNNQSIPCGMVLGMIEFSYRTSPDSPLLVNWELLDTEDPQVRDGVLEWLSAVGVPDGTWLYPDDHPIYIETKRRKRASWHQRTTTRLQTELEDLITLNTLPSTTTPPRTLIILRHLNHFISQHRKTLGFIPFLRGLGQTFQAQLRDPDRVWVWSLDDATFTQAGPEFLTATVTLLTQTLNFQPQPLDPSSSSNSPHHRHWQISPHLTHFQLLSLLHLITFQVPKLNSGPYAGTCQSRTPTLNRPSPNRQFTGLLGSLYRFLASPLARLLVLFTRLTTNRFPLTRSRF